jgi:3-hydroxyacyl-CoA dehydrogenase
MEEQIYSIFKVYDYKGGELDSVLNQTRERMIAELAESHIFEHPELPYNDSAYIMVKEENYSLNEVEQILNEAKFESGLYAGGDVSVIAVYEHINNKLERVNLSSFKSEVISYILTQLKETK